MKLIYTLLLLFVSIHIVFAQPIERVLCYDGYIIKEYVSLSDRPNQQHSTYDFCKSYIIYKKDTLPYGYKMPYYTKSVKSKRLIKSRIWNDTLQHLAGSEELLYTKTIDSLSSSMLIHQQLPYLYYKNHDDKFIYHIIKVKCKIIIINKAAYIDRYFVRRRCYNLGRKYCDGCCGTQKKTLVGNWHLYANGKR